MMTEIEKTAVIDVGSNSVRLVVYHGAKRAPIQFFNEKVVCGLGRGLSQSGVLNPEGRIRAFNAIVRFVSIARRMGVKTINAVATAAVRNAKDGDEFVLDIMTKTNVRIKVLSGQEEGALSAQGIFYCRNDAQGLVCDMGGSSMELALVENGVVKHSATSDLGPLQAQSYVGDSASFKKSVDKQLEALTAEFDPQDTMYMIGGTIRAIAAIDMARKNYPLSVINEYTLPTMDFIDTLQWITESDVAGIMALDCVSTDRIAYVPHVASVLLGLLKICTPLQVVFSSFGIREGVLFEAMPDRIQRRDPLIEACQFLEGSNARFTEFGTTLFAWLQPIFKSQTDAKKRIIWAACLLHDVTWQSHPDYRAEISFDYATRANLVGINHQERIFLAVALIHRYKNKPSNEKLDELNPLLSQDDQNLAEALGRAMRLGAMLGGPDVAHMGKLSIKNGTLELIMDQDSAALLGEVVGRRLKSLAKSMGLTAEMNIQA